MNEENKAAIPEPKTEIEFLIDEQKKLSKRFAIPLISFVIVIVYFNLKVSFNIPDAYDLLGLAERF